MKAADISGIVFDRLTAVKVSGTYVAGKVMWECLCQCGNTTFANVSQLRQGKRTSCGCAKLAGNQIYKKTPKHGHCVVNSTATYRVWSGMLSRCTNPNVPQYHRYGGRGVKVCARWLIFENFLADMGEKPDELSLDRKDNDKDYCPENCRWATGKEQGRNKSTNVMWEYRGESKTISEWAESLGMDRHTLGDRVRKSGWTITQALETPVQTKAQIAAKVNKIRWGPLPQVRTD